jgi:adenylosuccinate lyase
MPSRPSASPHDTYQSPLAGRYASDEMKRLWSARTKYQTWRKIWLALAEAQHEVGLPVSKEQVEELRANLDVTDADIERAAELEAELRHDVMAHVHAWGERCPKAKPIIHLGMTSQDVNDNAELVLIQLAQSCIQRSVNRLASALGRAADHWKHLPALAFTHYQPASPTTFGRRCAQWGFDLLQPVERALSKPADKLRGLRGATGTQASYLKLVDGDRDRLRTLERLFLSKLGAMTNHTDSMSLDDWGETGDPETAEDYLFRHTFLLTGQTYPRSVDARVVSHLASICAVLHKAATDIRLLCNRKELDEPLADKQIGSSAMPYKRNPMRCERVCGLARFVINLVGNAYDTAATQWLERTLDDSSNRRLTLPEAFLATDACLNIMTNVIAGLEVHEAQVRKNLMAELPFLATENILMEAVKRGGDRQDLHERIRVHAREAAWRIKKEGAENDLIDRLKADPAFVTVHHLLDDESEDGLMNPMNYVGLAVEQTERFLRDVIEPLRRVAEDDDDGTLSAPPDDLKV